MKRRLLALALMLCAVSCTDDGVTGTSTLRGTYTLRTVGDTTILREARTMPDGAPRFATLFAGALLGGMAGHADELETHVSDTLRWIKDEAER